MPETERDASSAISSIFDTLDLIDPAVVKIKLLIQELWRRGLNWDTKIPDDLLQEWNIWRENVIKLSLLNFTSWINFCSNCEVTELHIFGDGSIKACVNTAQIKVVHYNSFNLMKFFFHEDIGKQNLELCF